MRGKIFLISLFIITGCVVQRKSTSADKGIGDTRTKEVEFVDANTFLLSEYSTEKSYGFTKGNPVKVGGKVDNGAANERRFLNALLGPKGEEVRYFRSGSCCHFKTPNGMINNTGLLDVYRVYWQGSKDTVDIYINMYDEGDLKIPVGFTAVKKR